MKTYKTKKRKQQTLYQKIIFGVFIVAVMIIGNQGVITENTVESLKTHYVALQGVVKVEAQVAEASNIDVCELNEVECNLDMYMVEVPVEEKSVEDQIRHWAEEADFPYTDYLVKLARCESTLNPEAINTQGNTPAGSRDVGVFQINEYWHPEVDSACSLNVECATKWTMWRIMDGYQHEWSCDRKI